MKNRIKEIVLSIVSSFGYHISPRISKLRPYGGVNKNKIVKTPLYVEFIGTSAVGKTTVMLATMKKYKKYVDYGTFLKRYSGSFKNIKRDTENNTFYQKIVLDKIIKMTKVNTVVPSYIAWYIGSFHDKINNDIQITKYNKDYIVLSDEGLIKHFYQNIIDIYSDGGDKTEIKDNLKNRLYVYCYNSPETIFRQIIKRKHAMGYIYKGKSQEEIYEILKSTLEKERQFIKLLEDLNIPVLKINTADKIEDNADKVHQFLFSYQS